ncbi:hypothetical protein EHQ58_15750 [Leptospira ognonensis]|uniref:Uncharacterized protein n=1 Tax=Leptospira ognonensis TaxID=2484945 RepID=A0A4R9JV07_9LEPT|nr:hypothetical protein [Leptospira ognonensis]TGL56652.1 hypothetical protein EHQ58_15750 [Leptospira ognonensis]
MVPLYGAILCSTETESHLDLILARLKMEGLPAHHVNPKNWKDEREGIRVFTKVSPSLAGELLEWSIEPLLYGSFSSSEKEGYIKEGVSLLWDRPITELFQMPIFMMKQSSCFWSICTSHPKVDKHLGLILKSFGQLVSIEGEPDQLISRLRTSPINLVILDWDQKQLELQSKIPILRKLKEEKEILFLGIKNFEKDHLYRDLAYGISDVSPSLFSITEIVELIVRSLPVHPPNSQTLRKRTSIRKLVFEFQEKIKPTRYKFIDSYLEEGNDSREQIEIKNLVLVFQWLFNRSIE